MDVVVILIALGTAALIAHRWRKTRNDAALPDSPSGRDRADLPTFRVAALGPSGSGKTVLLGCAFDEFSAFDTDRPLRLDLPLHERQELNRISSAATHPTEKWPDATIVGESRTHEFACIADLDGKEMAVMKLHYMDYSGELLEGKGAASEVSRLEKYIAGSHAVLGVLDGVEIRSWIRGEQRGVDYMARRTKTILQLVASATCPVHLVITKWDVVHGIGEQHADDESRLHVVRRALLDVPHIEKMVGTARQRDQRIRLIPVSSVGEGFAAIDETGRVTKLGQSIGRQQNIIVPLAAVIPDYLDTLVSRMEEHDRELVLEWETKQHRRKQLLALSASVRNGIKSYVPKPYGLPLDMGVGLIESWLRRRTGGNAPAGSASNDLAAAQTVALEALTKSVTAFEWDLPSSVLAPGR